MANYSLRDNGLPVGKPTSSPSGLADSTFVYTRGGWNKATKFQAAQSKPQFSTQWSFVRKVHRLNDRVLRHNDRIGVNNG